MMKRGTGYRYASTIKNSNDILVKIKRVCMQVLMFSQCASDKRNETNRFRAFKFCASRGISFLHVIFITCSLYIPRNEQLGKKSLFHREE